MRCCTRRQRHSIQIQTAHTMIFVFFFCRLHLFTFALHVFCLCVRSACCVACVRAVRDDVRIVQAFASRLTYFSIFPRMERSSTGKKRKSGRKPKKNTQRQRAFSIFDVPSGNASRFAACVVHLFTNFALLQRIKKVCVCDLVDPDTFTSHINI